MEKIKQILCGFCVILLVLLSACETSIKDPENEPLPVERKLIDQPPTKSKIPEYLLDDSCSTFFLSAPAYDSILITMLKVNKKMRNYPTHTYMA